MRKVRNSIDSGAVFQIVLVIRHHAAVSCRLFALESKETFLDVEA